MVGNDDDLVRVCQPLQTRTGGEGVVNPLLLEKGGLSSLPSFLPSAPDVVDARTDSQI